MELDHEQQLISDLRKYVTENLPLSKMSDEELAENTPVSMNLFGFTPDYFDYSEAYFRTWYDQNHENLKSEFYIPTMVNKLISDGTVDLHVLRSSAQWHGVTYK